MQPVVPGALALCPTDLRTQLDSGGRTWNTLQEGDLAFGAQQASGRQVLALGRPSQVTLSSWEWVGTRDLARF